METALTTSAAFRSFRPLVCSIVATGLLALAAHSVFGIGTTVINFDDVSVPGGDGNQSVFPGNLYASSGVLFSTGNLDTDTIAVGGTVNFAKLNDDMQIANSSLSAVSQPNMVLPSPSNNFPDPNLVFYDLLLTFTTPVTSVNVTSDRFGFESPDVIRLLAMHATATPGQFDVLAFDQKFDDALAPPANLLSVSLGGNSFSHALIEVISENEGFDNVTFTSIPEPSTMLILLVGILTMCCADAANHFKLAPLRKLSRFHRFRNTFTGTRYQCRKTSASSF